MKPTVNVTNDCSTAASGSELGKKRRGNTTAATVA
jgi:hypothetical protein